MKYFFYLLTAAISLAACSNDPKANASTMSRREKLCNNPWGNADTTNSASIRRWLERNSIRYENAAIFADTLSKAILDTHNCDTLTGREVVAIVFYSDTAKARQLGLTITR